MRRTGRFGYVRCLRVFQIPSYIPYAHIGLNSTLYIVSWFSVEKCDFLFISL